MRGIPTPRTVLLPLVAVASLVGCWGGPFLRGRFDPRDPERFEVVRIRENGSILLSSGETVRLFGIQLPEDSGGAAQVLALLCRHVGAEGSIRVGLPADTAATHPAAVELTIWRRALICGHGLSSWTPCASPLPTHLGFSLAESLVTRFENVVAESDLSHPDADPMLVECIRRADGYRKRVRIERQR